MSLYSSFNCFWLVGYSFLYTDVIMCQHIDCQPISPGTLAVVAFVKLPSYFRDVYLIIQFNCIQFDCTVPLFLVRTCP